MDDRHMEYWTGVKESAESMAAGILGGGNLPVSFRDALCKDCIEKPEDWDELLEWCIDEGILKCDMMRLQRCEMSWMQAWNELEFKSQHP